MAHVQISNVIGRKQEQKKKRSEKFPDPRLIQSGYSGDIFSADSAEKKFGFDAADQQSDYYRRPQPETTWFESRRFQQKTAGFHQQRNSADYPEKRCEGFKRSMGND